MKINKLIFNHCKSKDRYRHMIFKKVPFENSLIHIIINYINSQLPTNNLGDKFNINLNL
jgi:hypothetical protein